MISVMGIIPCNSLLSITDTDINIHTKMGINNYQTLYKYEDCVEWYEGMSDKISIMDD